MPRRLRTTLLAALAASATFAALSAATAAVQAAPKPAATQQPIAACTARPAAYKIAQRQHYLSYRVKAAVGFQPPKYVTLKNSVSPTPFLAVIGSAIWHWNPSCKFRNGAVFKILDPTVHYLCFIIKAKTQDIKPQVVTDQFVTAATLKLGQPDALCLPSWKSLTGLPNKKPNQPLDADHYTCYPVLNPVGTPTRVKVQDEFSPKTPVPVTVNSEPLHQQLCVPTQKTLASGRVYRITNPKLSYWCRSVTSTPIIHVVFDENQFGQGRVTISKTKFLCVPATVTPAKAAGNGRT
jgi:hypothetical protein